MVLNPYLLIDLIRRSLLNSFRRAYAAKCGKTPNVVNSDGSPASVTPAEATLNWKSENALAPSSHSY